MEIPAYLRVLWHYRLAVGGAVVVAAVVALVAHFDLKDGDLTYRGDREYSAAVTVLLGGGPRTPYSAETPAFESEPGMSAAQADDLSSTAVIYAYLASGEAVRTQVATLQGPLGERESIGGVRRTTQPAGTEKNAGRFTLPILSIIGTSLDPDRAIELSRTATAVFLDQVAQQQDADGIPTDTRVTLTVTDEAAAVAGELGTIAIPIAATGLAAFAVGILAIFAAHALRLNRRGEAAAIPRRAARAQTLQHDVAEALERETTRAR